MLSRPLSGPASTDGWEAFVDEATVVKIVHEPEVVPFGSAEFGGHVCTPDVDCLHETVVAAAAVVHLD